MKQIFTTEELKERQEKGYSIPPFDQCLAIIPDGEKNE